MKRRKGKDWIPLWVDKWLFGSVADELEPDEQGAFIRLLCLAAKDEGFIRANEGVPYPPKQLAGLLRINPKLLSRTIEKCIQVEKLERLEDGTLYITGWKHYQLNQRHKRRFASNKDIESAETDTESAKKDIESVKDDSKKRKKGKREKKEKEIIKAVRMAAAPRDSAATAQTTSFQDLIFSVIMPRLREAFPQEKEKLKALSYIGRVRYHKGDNFVLTMWKKANDARHFVEAMKDELRKIDEEKREEDLKKRPGIPIRKDGQ